MTYKIKNETKIAEIFTKYLGFCQHEQANGYTIKQGLAKDLGDAGLSNKQLKPILSLRDDLSGSALEKFIQDYKPKII